MINWNMGVQVWNIEAGNLISQIGFENYQMGNFSASDINPPYFARNNSDQDKGWIELWNMDIEQVMKLPMEDGSNDPIIFSPDASILITQNYSQTLRIWDIEMGNLLLFQHMNQLSRFAINPARNILAILIDGYVELYDLSQITQMIKAKQSITSTPTP